MHWRLIMQNKSHVHCFEVNIELRFSNESNTASTLFRCTFDVAAFKSIL